MQQLLEAFGIQWSLLIAQAVNFGIVLIALWYFLYKPVMTMLEKRKRVVAQGVEDAAKAGEMLAQADGQAAERVSAAEGQAESIVTAARESATVEKTRLLREAETRAAAIARDSEARAEETVERARRESEKEVARLAVLAAEKILTKHHD